MLLNSDPVSEDTGLLLLRATAGGSMFFAHGLPKLMNFSDKMNSFGDPIGLGPAFSLGLITFAETVCAALIALGLWTRISTIPLVIGMAVAVFITHGDHTFQKQEMALLYMMVFIALFFTGSGRFSLDRLNFR